MGVNMPNKTFDSIPEDKVEYDLSDRIQIAWHVSEKMKNELKDVQ
jgi:hypothetical protein